MARPAGCPGDKDMERPPLAPATNRPAVETHVVTEEAKPTRSGSPLANTLLGFDGAAARPAAERVCCARAPRPPPEEGPPAEQDDDDDDDAELALLREQLKATERALERRKREEAAATPFLAAVFEDATFAPPATPTPPTSPPGLVAPEAARPQVQAAAAARDRLEQTRKPRPVWKSTSALGAFTTSFLGNDVAALAPSSGEEPTSPRHRSGVASMAWRTTRRFRTNVP